MANLLGWFFTQLVGAKVEKNAGTLKVESTESVTKKNNKTKATADTKGGVVSTGLQELEHYVNGTEISGKQVTERQVHAALEKLRKESIDKYCAIHRRLCGVYDMIKEDQSFVYEHSFTDHEEKLRRIECIRNRYNPVGKRKELSGLEALPGVRRIVSPIGQNVKQLAGVFFESVFGVETGKFVSWGEHQEIAKVDISGVETTIKLGPCPTEKQVELPLGDKNKNSSKKTLIVSAQLPLEPYTDQANKVPAKDIFSKSLLVTGTTPNVKHFIYDDGGKEFVLCNGASATSDSKVYRVNIPLVDHTSYDNATGEPITGRKLLDISKALGKLCGQENITEVIHHCWSGKERGPFEALVFNFYAKQGKSSLKDLANNIHAKRIHTNKIEKLPWHMLLSLAEFYVASLSEPGFLSNYAGSPIEKIQQDLAIFKPLREHVKSMKSTDHLYDRCKDAIKELDKMPNIVKQQKLQPDEVASPAPVVSDKKPSQKPSVKPAPYAPSLFQEISNFFKQFIPPAGPKMPTPKF